MRLDEHPAGESIHHLRRGIQMIRLLKDDSFVGTDAGPFRGGVGSQFRHCIDFYDRFLHGLSTNEIDYCGRKRDPRVEHDREFAVETASEIVRRLGEIEPADLDKAVRVRSDHPVASLDPDSWSRSTVRRELQFLASHTVHHYALIVALLSMQGVRLDGELADLGVAPSTLEHWKESSRTHAPHVEP